jgi:hypothetical protein
MLNIKILNKSSLGNMESPDEEDVQKRVRKQFTQIQKGYLGENREEWRRLCHRKTHHCRNFSG